MCGSAPQGVQGLRPDELQRFAICELVVALQAPGEHHLGATDARNFRGKRCLCVLLVAQGVRVWLRGCRLDSAGEAQDLQVLIHALEEKLSLSS